MAKGEGGGGNFAERQAQRKPIKQVSVDAGSDAIVRAIVKPKAKPVVKRKVIPLPRAKPAKAPMLADKFPRATRIPGSAAGLPPRGPAPAVRSIPIEHVREPAYPTSTGTRGDREDMGAPYTFGNWDIAQQAQGQGLLHRIQEFTTGRNLDQANLNTQRIKRRGMPITTIE